MRLLCCHYWGLVFIHQVCALLAMSTVAGWNSKGISYRDLNRSDFNVRSNINFFIAVAVICIIFLSINVFIVLLNKRPIPPKIVSYSPYLSNSVSLYQCMSLCVKFCVFTLCLFWGELFSIGLLLSGTLSCCFLCAFIIGQYHSGNNMNSKSEAAGEILFFESEKRHEIRPLKMDMLTVSTFDAFVHVHDESKHYLSH